MQEIEHVKVYENNGFLCIAQKSAGESDDEVIILSMEQVSLFIRLLRKEVAEYREVYGK